MTRCRRTNAIRADSAGDWRMPWRHRSATRWARISAGVSSAWLSGRAPHQADQHRGDQGAVDLPEDPRLRPRARAPAPARRRCARGGPGSTCFFRRKSRASPCCISRKKGRWRRRSPRSPRSCGRARSAAGSSLRLDAVEPADEEVEGLGHDAEVEVLLGREVAVERALADPGAPRRRRPCRPGGRGAAAKTREAARDDVLALRRLARRPVDSGPSSACPEAPGVSRPRRSRQRKWN